MNRIILWITIGSMAVLIATLFLSLQTKAAIDTVSLSTSVQEYLSFDITTGDTVGFGPLTPGTHIHAPAGPPAGTIASVLTNSANGYTLGLHDSVTGSNSALVQSGTYIIDYAAPIATPTVWSAGTDKGLGITLFAADTNKEIKWGTGTTYDDVLNKYAGIPETASIAHTVTGYHASADTSSWAYAVDVPNTQKTGSYSGSMTFTAAAVLT